MGLWRTAFFFGESDGDPSTALGSCNCIHNFVAPPLAGNCSGQNLARNILVDQIDKKEHLAVHAKTAAYPNFSQWPKHNSLLHQQMWVDWIRRAKEGGLRVMVALTVNNHCIADAAETTGPNDDYAFEAEDAGELSGIKYDLPNVNIQLSNPIFRDGLAAATKVINPVPVSVMPTIPGNYPTAYPKRSRNIQGLTPKGEMAIAYMMKKGMIIDIDHMSEKSVAKTLDVATKNNYPVVSGHNSFRFNNALNPAEIQNENERTDEQVRRIYQLGGLMGIGHSGNAGNFVSNYRYGMKLTGNAAFAIGTDVNGLNALPGPVTRPEEKVNYRDYGNGGNISQCKTGNKSWDFNTEGMAHYGLFPDFLESCTNAGLGTKPAGASTSPKDALFSSAERFAQMWEKCVQTSPRILWP